MTTPQSVALSSLATFDARQVPVVGVDDHLPAVARERLQPQLLRQRFAAPPPWSPEILSERRFTDRREAPAAVLVPIVMRGSELDGPMVLLTQRTAHMSSHAGQVAFPGGKADPQDSDAAATALREAQEEVGLQPGLVEIVGTLPTYFTGSAFVVTPVIGLVQPHFSLDPNPGEVADVFEVPLHFLMDPANHRRHMYDAPGGRREWFSMVYVHPHSDKEHFIWGATAGMLRNLYRFLVA